MLGRIKKICAAIIHCLGNKKQNQTSMHLLKKENLLGSYSPAFYYIYLKTDKDLDDFSNLTKEEITVFIHEYTHFLQDILTIYGLRNILQVTDSIKSLIQQLKDESTSPIQLPITLKNEVIRTNNDLISYYYGDDECKFSFNKIDNYKVYTEQLLNPISNKNIEVPHIILEVYNSFDPKKIIKEFHFGVISIVESMAYLIESAVLNISNPPFVPYRIVELIAKETLPNVAWSKAMLVALCEISLQTYNPPHKFIDILDRMKDIWAQ